MDRFLSIEAFVRVAQAQSFAEAARQLRLSKSVVTARVQQLEDLLGGPLFHRTTRAVRLSEMGQAFFRDCHELVSRTNEIVDQMREVRGSPAGLLRVHVLTGFALGHSHLGHLLRDFQERYPEVVLDLYVSEAVIDPVKEGYDVRAADLSRGVRGAGVAPSVSRCDGCSARRPTICSATARRNSRAICSATGSACTRAIRRATAGCSTARATAATTRSPRST